MLAAAVPLASILRKFASCVIPAHRSNGSLESAMRRSSVITGTVTSRARDVQVRRHPEHPVPHTPHAAITLCDLCLA